NIFLFFLNAMLCFHAACLHVKLAGRFESLDSQYSLWCFAPTTKRNELPSLLGDSFLFVVICSQSELVNIDITKNIIVLLRHTFRHAGSKAYGIK
ncbi:MAG: hypothetical protein K6G87_00825, partial [Butyrivibrio sp.]|uniref:hypothetical protein n=1 Tax=Butyrivibrio sp. TaxID=28121 RepID=UPI0025E04EBD